MDEKQGKWSFIFQFVNKRNNISKNEERNSISICLQNYFLVPVTKSNVL